MKVGKIAGKYHNVFESDEDFKQYWEAQGRPAPDIVSNWREGQVGDWVRADDGGIVEILVRREYTDNTYFNGKNRRSHYVRTVVGTFPNNKYSSMDTDFEKHPNKYSFSGGNRRTDRLSGVEKRMILYLLMGHEPETAYLKSHKTFNKVKFNEFMKSERFLNEMGKRLFDVAKQLGIDTEYILKGLKKLVEESESDSVKLNSLTKLGEYIGLKEEGVSSGRGPVAFEDVDVMEIENQRVEALGSGDD